MTEGFRRILPVLATGCLAVTVPWWPPLVMGEHVVSPLVLFGVALAADVVAVSRAPRGPARMLLAVVSFLVLGLVAGIFGLSELGTRQLVLPERGPGGCRVVAVESAFLQAGRGSVAVISAPVGFAHVQGRYDADDGGRPFTRDGYQLTWHADDASLELFNAQGPVWPARHWLYC